MAVEYSVDLCNELKERFESKSLHRPMRVGRYDAGAELNYQVQSVDSGLNANVSLHVEKFVGGGYAGQVYRVKVTAIDGEEGWAGGLQVGSTYAMKILLPPSAFSRIFRNVLYWIGFQGPFQLQVNPTAARSGAIWQKFIRRGARIRFGSEMSVNDIHAMFVDGNLGSCGEISDWVEGRTWRLEVDENLDALKLWKKGRAVAREKLGSPEYRAKYRFMHEFVKLLGDMGAYEFARQYEWSTCKSQPNCLKRTDCDEDPEAGLVAVDFRAGLALLPCMPMSPGDFKLIINGLSRGSLVQFDRGDLKKLGNFVDSYPEDFSGMIGLLGELERCEEIYRDSLPDITHNHVRLLYSGKLWSRIFDSAVTGWKVRGLVDEQAEKKLRTVKILTFLFFLLGVIPFLGGFLRKLFGRRDYRKHYGAILTNFDYLKRAASGRMIEKTIVWHRAGRVTAEKARKVSQCIFCFVCHTVLSVLPVGVHRFFTDPAFAKEKLYTILLIKFFKLYFSSKLRAQWLLDMLEEGKKNHIVSDEDAETITSQISEPYIQRYLNSLVVHGMTAPVTQIVFAIIAWWYVKAHPEMSGAEAVGAFWGIMAIGQIVPISPGSICRGLYTTGLAIYDRNFKDYNIALFLSYCKYIGYLAFPIQMNYRYPALARFMAAHWATGAVHIVPVFGERGAVLEHWVFSLFYNWPLTIGRRMRRRTELRAVKKPRLWHIPFCALVPAVLFGLAEVIYFDKTGHLPRLRNIWYLVIILPYLAGSATTLLAGGMVRWKRIISATISGVLTGGFYAIITIFIAQSKGMEFAAGDVISWFAWRMFPFAIISTLAAIITELKLGDPDLK